MRFSSLLSRKECVDKQHTENCHSSSARKTQSASPLCSRQAPHSFLQTSQRLPEWIPTDRFQYCAVHLSTADREMRQRQREKQICCAGNVRLTQVEFISTELEGRAQRGSNHNVPQSHKVTKHADEIPLCCGDIHAQVLSFLLETPGLLVAFVPHTATRINLTPKLGH